VSIVLQKIVWTEFDSPIRGNFRLLVRLLPQMQLVLAINGLESLAVDVVETAGENLVIDKPDQMPLRISFGVTRSAK
jgi:hypothetical protein